jgi:hypothetical protein
MVSLTGGLTVGLPAINMIQATLRAWATNQWNKVDDFMDATNLWGLINKEEANRWAGAIATEVGLGITGFAAGKVTQYRESWKKKTYNLQKTMAANPLKNLTMMGAGGASNTGLMTMMMMNQLSAGITQYVAPRAELTDAQLAALIGAIGGD